MKLNLHVQVQVGIRPSVCLSVRPSVCQSVTFVYSVETRKHIFNFFSLSDSHSIVVFPHQTSWQYSNGNPLMRASNVGKVGKKITIFDKYLA